MIENKNTLYGISKTYTLETTPEYFGAYLNIARHNVFMISQEMSRKFNKPKLGDDGDIGNTFLTKPLSFTDPGGLIYLNLCRYLPLANAFSSDFRRNIGMDDDATGTDIVKLAGFLKMAFKELCDFRNEYTHYFSIDTDTRRKVNIENELALQLRELFEMAVKLTKKRFQDVIPNKCFDNVEKSIEALHKMGITDIDRFTYTIKTH